MQPFPVLFFSSLLAGCATVPASLPKCDAQNSRIFSNAMSNPENGKAHFIVNVGSGKVVDIQGASPEAGAPAIQWPHHKGINQKFILHNLGNGYYKIEAAHSRLVLDVTNADIAAGAIIQQWQENGQENQAWQLVSAGEGQYRIISQHTRQLLTVAGNTSDEGAYLIQAPDYNSAFQRWLIVPVAKAVMNCEQP